MYEARLHYTEPLLRESVRFFFIQTLRRRFGLPFFVALAVLVAILTWLILRHDRDWTVGVFAAFLVFAGLFFVMLYLSHYRNTIGRFRQMRTPEGTLSCDEQGITFASELGSSTVPWSTITEVWRHPRFWLLLFSPAQFVTLPLDDLDESTRDFITRMTGHAKA